MLLRAVLSSDAKAREESWFVARRSDAPCEQVCRRPGVVAGTGGGAWSLRCHCSTRGSGWGSLAVTPGWRAKTGGSWVGVCLCTSESEYTVVGFGGDCAASQVT